MKVYLTAVAGHSVFGSWGTHGTRRFFFDPVGPEDDGGDEHEEAVEFSGAGLQAEQVDGGVADAELFADDAHDGVEGEEGAGGHAVFFPEASDSPDDEEEEEAFERGFVEL